jgi:hypothetical protein
MKIMASFKCSLILPILLLCGAGSRTSRAQSGSPFIVTGSMITPREGQTATLLLNGKVLIAGGHSGNQDDWPDDALASAELYDAATGAFAATGSMTVPRVQHTATLLPDGRVLIAGGTDLSAEIYDPSAGSFAATGNMVAHPYEWQGTTLLQNGRVFIGGYPTAQIYDPVTGTFSATGPYAGPAPAILEKAILLADGRVLLTGAVNVCFQPLCADPGTGWAELYDPNSGTFSLAGSMKWWNTVYSATLLTSGKVLFAGNDNYNGIPSSAEIFDPSDGTFTVVESPSVSPNYGAAVLLPDGTVLVTGGNGQVVSELYIPARATFSPAGNMVAAASMQTATLLPDGTVLIAGGFAALPSSAELYHPAVLVPSPKLFSLSGDGKGQGAIWHAATGQVVSPANPAAPGEVLSTYTTGLGAGSVIPPQVAIGGRAAGILFFGTAPGYPGYNQVNFVLADGVTPGLAVPVRLTYLDRPSNEVSISVR